MSGIIAKPKNGKRPLPDDPFHIVVSRGIARFIEREKLSIPKAAEKFGLHYRSLKRLIDEPTPGLIGENIDKVWQAFGITRQHLIDLGTPP